MKKSRVQKRSAKKSILQLLGTTTGIMLASAAVAGSLSLVYASLAMPDSLVAKWLVRPLALASVSTVDPTGGLPAVGTSTSTTTPAPASLKPMKIGMNISGAAFWSTNRIFMNLASGDGWVVDPAGGGSTDSYFNANRNVIKVLPGDNVYRYILRPPSYYLKKSTDVVCKWDGVGTFDYFHAPWIKNESLSANKFSYTLLYLDDNLTYGMVYIKLLSVDPANPVRNFDCREAGADQTALFDPNYVASVKRYNTIRFMDWQGINGNKPITWATRTSGTMEPIVGQADGYAIEHMIALANEAHVNPWFCMPWNADDDYIRKFAEMVRDRLDPTLVAYIETGNELWNYQFPMTIQARDEGMAENLSPDSHQAMLYRYAEKLSHHMDIWASVFAGQMNRIVRVAASQNASAWSIDRVLEFRDTATKIDAISSAPYFYGVVDNYTDTPASLDQYFVDMKADLDDRFARALDYKQRADAHHLRYVAYEAGQHALGNVALLTKVQNDPRMGQIYTHYLTRWNNEIGDLINLYNDIGPTSQYGAWGMMDFVGQNPMSKPKSKAVTLFLASIGK